MPRTLRDFLRSIHRRHVLARVAEQAGFGAALVTLPLLGLSCWRFWTGASPISMVHILAIISAGSFIAATIAIFRRPTLAQTAIRADCQLDKSDLLATALWAAEDPMDPWRSAAVARADQTCRGLAPASVRWRRFGAAPWGGLFVAIAMAICMGSAPDPSRPASFPAAHVDRGTAVPSPAILTPILLPDHRSVLPPEAQDAPSAAATDASRPDEVSGPSKAPAHDNSSRPSPNGGGGALSRERDIHPPAAARTVEAAGTDPKHDGAASGGSGHAQSQSSPGQDAPNGTVAQQQASQTGAGRASPASTPAESDAEAAAASVPAAYRDIVRDFFRR